MGDGSAAWRTRNAGYLLFASTDRCVRDKLDVLRREGFGAVSEALVTLLLNLDRDGTRLTTVAARAGQTKQSMIELVDRAEALGLVERRLDPTDMRAKVVAFSASGFRALDALHLGLRHAEQRVAESVGSAFLAEMRARLCRYSAAPMKDASAVPDAPAVAAENSWRTFNIGRLLALSARRFVRDVLSVVHERGYRDVTEVLLALFRNLDLDGTRLTEIAARARMTKQSMRELVDRAEALGYVERRRDPSDGRAKTIIFTAAGLQMLEHMRSGVEQAERRFAAITSADFVDELKRRLVDYIKRHSATDSRDVARERAAEPA